MSSESPVNGDLLQESIERGNRVMRLLGALYKRYYTEAEGGEGEMTGVLQDLNELMQAYDEWLD